MANAGFENAIKNYLDKRAESDRLFAESAKLAKMPFGTPEATVIRNYIETCLELPWNRRTKDRVNIKLAQKILGRGSRRTCQSKRPHT